MLVSFASCKKDKKDELKFLPGSWEPSRDIAGFSAGSTYAPGSGYYYTFTATDFKKYEAGILADSGSYAIVKDLSEITNEYGDRMIFNNQYNSAKRFISIENDELIISTEFPFSPTDSYVSTLYIRIP